MESPEALTASQKVFGTTELLEQMLNHLLLDAARSHAFYAIEGIPLTISQPQNLGSTSLVCRAWHATIFTSPNIRRTLFLPTSTSAEMVQKPTRISQDLIPKRDLVDYPDLPITTYNLPPKMLEKSDWTIWQSSHDIASSTTRTLNGLWVDLDTQFEHM